MRITLTDGDGDRLMNGEVADENWVQNCIDAGWAYLNHTGARSITVRSNEPPATDSGAYRAVCTVSLTIWEEGE